MDRRKAVVAFCLYGHSSSSCKSGLCWGFGMCKVGASSLSSAKMRRYCGEAILFSSTNYSIHARQAQTPPPGRSASAVGQDSQDLSQLGSRSARQRRPRARVSSVRDSGSINRYLNQAASQIRGRAVPLPGSERALGQPAAAVAAQAAIACDHAVAGDDDGHRVAVAADSGIESLARRTAVACPGYQKEVMPSVILQG